MSRNKGRNPDVRIPNQEKFTNSVKKNEQPSIISLLDVMEDGHEFESLLKYQNIQVELTSEMRRSLTEISNLRGRPNIAYIANVVNPNVKASISVEYDDDLPFSELINTIPQDIRDIDIILVTPGGSGQQVAKFVDHLRPRFDHISFILPNIAMSAGTIFAMSGDEIIMTNNSYIGPIDPQVPGKDGRYVPAQSILTLIEEIRIKGENAIRKGMNPAWTDLQILNQIDPKEIGNALNSSKYSEELVANYLQTYKFRTWLTHSTGEQVTKNDRRKRAEEIAGQLCNHALWKTHGRGITRNVAWDTCKLKITHTESIANLDRAVKRFWALFYWIFENTPICKVFISDYYLLMRNDRSLIDIENQKK